MRVWTLSQQSRAHPGETPTVDSSAQLWGRGEATPRLGSHKPCVSVFIPTAMDKYMTQGSLGRKGLFWLVVQESHSIVAGKKWQQREGPSEGVGAGGSWSHGIKAIKEEGAPRVHTERHSFTRGEDRGVWCA